MSVDAQTASGHTVLEISGMTCSTCARVVANALARVPGACHVDVDLDTGRAVVAGLTRPEALVVAVEVAGFEARVAKGVSNQGKSHGR